MISNFLRERFSLQDDKADETEIIESIKRNVEFKGTNLWILIFAIFIASIGLNVNSTAVIIGAMLISPIMGPIMGIGLGIGINDIDLIRKAAKNLAIAAFMAIATSALYFLITPLQEAQSELLARTTPTIWDVFIALFGGLAGIVAGTRKEKSNVIPGVAIATALMPPLCTAGFGLAHLNFYYFLGALYLFFINSVFICISTYLIVRYLHFHKKEFEDPERKKRVTRYIVVIIILTALPSIYLGYRIVQKSIFETNANQFVRREFQFKDTYIVNKVLRFEDGLREIDLLLLGNDISGSQLDSLNKKLDQYHLHNTKLTVHQGLSARQQLDFAQIKANILQGIMDKQQGSLPHTPRVAANTGNDTFPDLSKEFRALYPGLKAYTLSKIYLKKTDSSGTDTTVLFYSRWKAKPRKADTMKLRNWLTSRINTNAITIIVD
jgi:uncharacterized hydrophobic protein (TIGR00271 family)